MHSRALVFGSVALISACQTFPGFSPADQAADQAILSQLGAYADLNLRLAEAEGVWLDAIYAEVAEENARAPSPMAKLRLATVLSAAGHAHTDWSRADQVLTELEATSDGQAPVMGSLVRLRRAAISQGRAVQNQLSVLTRENRSLSKGLEEAEAKIKALTAIEQKLEAPSAPADAPRAKQ